MRKNFSILIIWARTCYSCRIVLACLPLLLLAARPGHAQNTECPPFPEVPWWKGLTHESVSQYVQSNFDGDWTSYLTKWEKQLELIQGVYDRGSVVQISKDKIRLQGNQLLAYRDNIRQRVNVIRCLAGLKVEQKNAVLETNSVEDVPRNDPAAGRAKATEAGCEQCHGTDGNAVHPAVPHLAGQNDWYLVKQLKEFQKPVKNPDDTSPIGTIERHNPIMSPRAKELSEADIWNLAAFYSSQSCKPDQEQPDLAGQAPERAQSCIRCHGMMGKSIFPEIPNLAGQRRNFLIKQLTAYRETSEGERPLGDDQRYHYGMSEQARTLSNDEIEQLAAFFSGLECQ